MPAARKTRRLVVLAALLSLGAVAFAVWPRGPRLVWYTSPTVRDGRGRVIQVRGLIPADWQQVDSQEHTGAIDAFVTLSPKQRQRWLPAWLDRVVYPPSEPGAAI
jgi:hypothetical protein